MAIAFYAEDTKLPAIKKRAVGNWVKEVAATYGKKVGDISYIFCSDEKILEVNRQYLQHDYYTDIITFDYTSGDKDLGNASSWRPTKTKPWRYCRRNAGKVNFPGKKKCLEPLPVKDATEEVV